MQALSYLTDMLVTGFAILVCLWCGVMEPSPYPAVRVWWNVMGSLAFVWMVLLVLAAGQGAHS